jgi:hypothetical protein
VRNIIGVAIAGAFARTLCAHYERHLAKLMDACDERTYGQMAWPASISDAADGSQDRPRGEEKIIRARRDS